MKKRFTEEQIAYALRQAPPPRGRMRSDGTREDGAEVADEVRPGDLQAEGPDN